MARLKKRKSPSRIRMSEWQLIDRESIEKRKTEYEKKRAVREEMSSVRERQRDIPGRRDWILKGIIEAGLLTVLAWSPLPEASVPGWSVLLLEAVVFALVAASLFMKPRPGQNDILAAVMRWPRYLFGAWFVFLAFQVVPWPGFLVKLVSPESFAFWEAYGAGGGEPGFMSLSLVPGRTVEEGIELMAWAIFGFLVIKIVTRQDQIRRFFFVLVGTGIFQALLGFFEMFRLNPGILFHRKTHDLDRVTGTFLSPDHLSGYLEGIVPLAIGLLMAEMHFFGMAGLGWKEKVRRISKKFSLKHLFLVGAVLLMMLVVVLSGSRSGTFLMVFAMLLFVELSLLYGDPRTPRKGPGRNLMKMTCALITIVTLYAGVDAGIRRFGRDEGLRDVQSIVWRNAAGMVREYPVVGAGLGTFGVLYPAYEGKGPWARLEHAYNDYLEYLEELGIVGFGLLSGGIGVMMAACFLMWKVRHHPQIKGLTLGGLVAVVVMLIHCITDYSLHIPANRILFSAVVALTMVTAFSKREQPSDTSRDIPEAAAENGPGIRKENA